MISKTQFLLLAAVLFPSAAQANDAAIYVDCSGGGGCDCAIAAISPADVNLLLGIEGDPLPVVVQSPSGDFTTTARHPDTVHQDHGGTGACAISINAVPVDLPKVVEGAPQLLDPELETSTPEPSEITLVPPSTGLVPEDGIWAITPEPIEAIGECNPALMPELATLTEGYAHERPINWEGVFHPDRFLLARTATPIDWQPSGPNQFEALVKNPQSDIIKVFYSAELIAADAVELTVDLRLEGGPAIAGMANCTLHALLHARRIG
ncbi:hypothetical protein Q9295_02975 [Xinfangfangia sp. CPCC 101601]|uniref:Uncharacterized protein n=1 Tax=Pseudogemmobacter lacusdianii TaxID=3069608 RepID=A0ABU0VUC6_9RHOB|nr:hypothetical protein [Xinfangfangia sp. CPCC 101601]MDQ2065326.1 hypothetical protein [Xinfangfangia sp. CPCC 101601]